MNPSFPTMLAVVAVAAGCGTAPSADVRPRDRAWPDTGTPPASVAIERMPRYYVDEKGAIWDDRGRKHDKLPDAL